MKGSQLTGHDFTGVLLEAEIAISMDGKGSWRDNVFIERLWRSVKYKEVYLRAYISVAEARASIGRHRTGLLQSVAEDRGSLNPGGSPLNPAA